MLESEWFEKKVPKTKRTIYIPRSIVNNLNLKKYDKIAVEILYHDETAAFPIKVQVAMTKTGPSHRFSVPKRFQKYLNSEKILMKIIKLKYISIKNSSEDNQSKVLDLSLFTKQFKNLSATEWIKPNEIVIWHEAGTKRPCEPIIVSEKIFLTDSLTKYIGLYFAEGNKQGYYRTYATTPELARLVIRCYDKIIKNSNLTIIVNFDKSIRDSRINEEIEDILIDYWKYHVKPYKINDVKITTRKLDTLRDSEKRAKFGTLMIIDSRILPQLLHNLLIQKIVVISKINVKIAEKFFEGGILGDGSIILRYSRKKKAFSYLEIGTNKKEEKIWREIFKCLKIRYKKKIKKGNDVRIELNGYCLMIKLLHERFLKDFPEQRKKLIIGLRNRVETYIFQSLMNAPNNSVLFKGKFAMISSSYLVVGKRELITNRFINFNGDRILLTSNGTKFIDYLKDIEIIK